MSVLLPYSHRLVFYTLFRMVWGWGIGILLKKQTMGEKIITSGRHMPPPPPPPSSAFGSVFNVHIQSKLFLIVETFFNAEIWRWPRAWYIGWRRTRPRLTTVPMITVASSPGCVIVARARMNTSVSEAYTGWAIKNCAVLISHIFHRCWNFLKIFLSEVGYHYKF